MLLSAAKRLFFAALAFSFSGVHASIKDCSSGASVLKLTDLGLNPATPVSGQPLDMTVKFDNPGAEINDGTVVTTVSVNQIPLSPTTEPLCINTQCPIVTGANDRSTASTWPDVKGHITSKITWTRTDGSNLLCIQITVDVAEGEKNRTLLRGSGFKAPANKTAIAIAEALRLNAPIAAEERLVLYGPFFPLCVLDEKNAWLNESNAESF